MEWNNGALLVIFLMFFIPVVIIFGIIRIIIIKYYPILNSYIKNTRKDRIIVYLLIELGLLILAAGLTLGILIFINFMNDGRGILG
jgi:hypothetical protein